MRLVFYCLCHLVKTIMLLYELLGVVSSGVIKMSVVPLKDYTAVSFEAIYMLMLATTSCFNRKYFKTGKKYVFVKPFYFVFNVL